MEKIRSRSFKYKFGMPEVFAMIVGTVFLVAIGILMRNASLPYVLETEAIVIVVVATLFGPSAGGVIAVGATLVYIAFLHVDTSFVHILAYILLSAGIGHYANDFGVRDGTFNAVKALDFCVIHLLLEGFVWMFFIPFFEFLLFRKNLFDALEKSTYSLIFTTVTDVILVPLFFAISRMIIRRQKRSEKSSLLS
ncbi:MAG: hypothetical protein K6D90_09770 [Lachnospiraceae bacterium]|nr:hypothetical protein [Lachnospiraceae bacterium]